MNSARSPLPETDPKLDVPPVVVSVAGAVAAVPALPDQEPDKQTLDTLLECWILITIVAGLSVLKIIMTVKLKKQEKNFLNIANYFRTHTGKPLWAIIQS